MGEVGVRDPRAGQEDANLARELRVAGDGSRGLRRGGAALEGAGGRPELPRARRGPAEACQLELRSGAAGGPGGGIEVQEGGGRGGRRRGRRLHGRSSGPARVGLSQSQIEAINEAPLDSPKMWTDLAAGAAGADPMVFLDLGDVGMDEWGMLQHSIWD
ncbi:AP2/ERF domain-containing protein [Psidium guajava]|nr:AP2/ERF domain-containing protein [Psidium guajava]